MRWTALLLLAWWSAAWADEAKDKSKSEAPAGPAAEYRALVQETQKAQQDIVKAYRAAKTDEERDKLVADHSKVPATFAGRFLQFAAKNAKEPQALDALTWILTNASKAPEADKAADLVVSGHLDNPRLAALAPSLVRGATPAAVKVLRAVLDKNSDKEVQGQVCLALAQCLKAQTESGTLKAAEVATVSKEAEGFYERAVKEYAAVKAGRENVGTTATKELAELRKFGIGKTAPEIAAEDIDGKPFKLSDYKGKVVLLDFWGHW